MLTQTQTTAIGIFHDPRHAQEAVRALKQAGFRDDEIGVLGPDQDNVHGGSMGTRGAHGTTGEHAAEGALAGAATGAGVGALWALGIAAGLLPGIGPVVVGGLLTSVLASAAGGAAVAGVAGALIGMGVPEEEARYYEGEFQSGRTLVAVQSPGRVAEAWSILHNHAAYNRHGTPVTANS
jgi:hypothetical protein